MLIITAYTDNSSINCPGCGKKIYKKILEGKYARIVSWGKSDVRISIPIILIFLVLISALVTLLVRLLK